MISMPATGHIIAQRGSRAIAYPAVFGFCAALALPALAPTYATLIVAAVFFGAVKGAVDVSINAQAVTVENEVERPIMSSFDSEFSEYGERSELDRDTREGRRRHRPASTSSSRQFIEGRALEIG
jgi:hypothetical protein